MAGIFAEWEGVNSPTKGARLTPVTLKLARQCVESPQESGRAGRRVGGATLWVGPERRVGGGARAALGGTSWSRGCCSELPQGGRAACRGGGDPWKT